MNQGGRAAVSFAVISLYDQPGFLKGTTLYDSLTDARTVTIITVSYIYQILLHNKSFMNYFI